MTNTSLDFSKIEALKPLARLVDRIQVCSGKTPPFVIAGAQARDLLLKFGHGIDTGRQTADVDFAFRVNSWRAFDELRAALIRSGDFVEVARSPHKLRFKGTLEADVVPFGEAIERPDRTIAWPPDQDIVMSTFGFSEAFDSSLGLLLPEEVMTRVVSLPGLALLKLAAWSDRRLREPGKDAHDLSLIILNYLNAGNAERLYREFPTLLEAPDFDYEEAGAYILGRDVGSLLQGDARRRLAELLRKESDPGGGFRLVDDMKMDQERGIALLGAMKRGFGE